MISLLRIPIRRQQLLLAGVDLLILFVSLPVAVLVRGFGAPETLPAFRVGNVPQILIDFFRYYTGATTISIVVFLALFFVFDLYAPDRKFGSPRTLVYILIVSGLAIATIPVLYYFAPHWKVGRGLLIIQGGFIALMTFLWRLVYSRVHRRMAKPRRVLVIGAGAATRFLLEEVHDSFKSEIEIVGVLDDDPAKSNFELNGFRVIGGTRDLAKRVRDNNVEIIVFAISRGRHTVDAELMREILGLKTTGIEVYQFPTFFKKITGRVPIEFVEDTWLIFNQRFSSEENTIAARARRLLDVSVALYCLVVLSPVILLVAIAIKVTSRGPVVYRQERLGLNRRPYQMLKFRSMVADAEGRHGPVWAGGKADHRVTKLGRFLRRTRMDEIPNFINVLKGEMSIVGPRPERAHFVTLLEREIPHYGLRFSVKPGMTGWAQVNYSYGASVADARRKLQYEMFYVQERTLFLDLVILMKTAQTVILRPGS